MNEYYSVLCRFDVFGVVLSLSLVCS
jgi:hypothetical protein